jgi:hypothetical protein
VSASAVRAAFAAQAEVCAGMGSPFTARLCRLAAERLAPGDPVSDRLLGWPGDPGGRADAVPLRLAGALHDLVLGGDPGLGAVWPPRDGAASDAALWAAVGAAFAGRTAAILAGLDGPPQTNEPQRLAALTPGYLTVAAATGLPLVVSEIGASAGLNLIWNRYAYAFGATGWGDPGSDVRIAPDWRGAAPPTPALGPAAILREAAGCDRAPPDLADPAARRRLLAFVWADQKARLARTGAAIAAAQAAGVAVARADAADWLEARLAAPRPGAAHVVAHSIVWQYLGPERQARIRATLEAAGARASAAAPLAWLRLEADGGAPGAGLALTLWPGGTTRTLARADFHGSWVDWSGRD